MGEVVWTEAEWIVAALASRQVDITHTFGYRLLPVVGCANADEAIGFALRKFSESDQSFTYSNPTAIRADFSAAREAELRAEVERLRAMLDEAREVLDWYGEQSRLARLIHREGDAGRHAIAADGGTRARATLAKIGAALNEVKA
jgi:hypothetical protein